MGCNLGTQGCIWLNWTPRSIPDKPNLGVREREHTHWCEPERRTKVHVSLDPGHTSKLVARPGRCNRGQEMTVKSRNTCIVKTGEKKSNTIPELIKMPNEPQMTPGRPGPTKLITKKQLEHPLLHCQMGSVGDGPDVYTEGYVIPETGGRWESHCLLSYPTNLKVIRRSEKPQ